MVKQDDEKGNRWTLPLMSYLEEGCFDERKQRSMYSILCLSSQELFNQLVDVWEIVVNKLKSSVYWIKTLNTIALKVKTIIMNKSS